MKKGHIFLLVLILSALVFSMCGPNGTPEDNPAEGQEFIKEVANREMVSVPGGTYTQSNGVYSFEHTISDFSIGKFEVTYELWYTVYQWAIEAEHGYKFANKGREGKDGTIGAEPTRDKYEPVTCINWRDLIVWCNAYSEIIGLTPVYKSDGNILKDSTDSNADVCDAIKIDKAANGYRLPTEGEWQYAASYKDGNNFTPQDHPSGSEKPSDDEEACKKVAWYDANSGGETHPVGDLTPNALGIYDMSGNVWEWCQDWYYDYPEQSATNHLDEEHDNLGRVQRGGCWYDFTGNLQVGLRAFGAPHINEANDLGFRLVRRP